MAGARIEPWTVHPRAWGGEPPWWIQHTPPSVEEHEGIVHLTARDLAVRNFGGRFARTALKSDARGRLLSEHVDI